MKGEPNFDIKNISLDRCGHYKPLVRGLIEKVTVYEHKFTVEFKSGMSVDV